MLYDKIIFYKDVKNQAIALYPLYVK